MPEIYKGYEILEDINMVVPGEPYEVGRTWYEQLFTRPWNPFKETKMVTPMVPSREMVLIGRKVIGHPEVIDALRKVAKEKEPERWVNL